MGGVEDQEPRNEREANDRKFVVQVYEPSLHSHGWVDLETVDALDAATALKLVLFQAPPRHAIQETTYRVAELALTVGVSINLTRVERQYQPDLSGRNCRCANPDVWVRAGSQGNEYRCSRCGGYVYGQETHQ